jgi:autoinducer 2-degrading protein
MAVSMISLLVTLEIAPDRVDEFLAYIKEEAADARTKEPGCRRFEISRSVDRPNVFSLTEGYDDLAALEAHRQTPHFLLFRQRADGGLILSKSSVCGEVIDA